jgi:hypothetical protein
MAQGRRPGHVPEMIRIDIYFSFYLLSCPVSDFGALDHQLGAIGVTVHVTYKAFEYKSIATEFHISVDLEGPL